MLWSNITDDLIECTNGDAYGEVLSYTSLTSVHTWHHGSSIEAEQGSLMLCSSQVALKILHDLVKRRELNLVRLLSAICTDLKGKIIRGHLWL